ncbi:MAG TPA: prolyl oligopeptidase family serine peptidase [Chloroflexia bacterium]|nr:prolyl oligopeptidase family serine peptidase [Chloroflexia bacterium]
MLRSPYVLLRAALLLVLAPLAAQAADSIPRPAAQAAPQVAKPLPGTPMCFPETGYCLRGEFLLYWRLNGGLTQFGYPVTPELVEGGRTVQYTERARFELHNGSGVLLGLLGNSTTAGRTDGAFRPATAGVVGTGTFYPLTKHNLRPPFAAYWQEHGGLPVYGYPISEAFPEKSPTDGKEYLVQYFERHRLEYHPEAQASGPTIQLGLLGRQAYARLYGAEPALKPDPSLAPDPVSLDALRRRAPNGHDLQVGRALVRTAAYTQYAMTYRSAGRRISGVMYVPAGKGPFPVVIMNHGYIPISQYTTGMDSRRESPFLAGHGFVAIHPDFRNYATSDDDPDAAANMSSIGWTEDALNLVAAVRESTLPSLDASRIGVWGHSNGGQVGLQMMSIATGIKGYVLFAPTSPDYTDNFNRWQRSGADAARIKAAHGFPEDNPTFYRGISAGPWFDQVSAPVLIFHGTGDTNTPYAWSVRTVDLLRAAGKDVRFVSPPGENHLFSDRAWSGGVGAQLLDFFERNVKGRSQ